MSSGPAGRWRPCTTKARLAGSRRRRWSRAEESLVLMATEGKALGPGHAAAAAAATGGGADKAL